MPTASATSAIPELPAGLWRGPRWRGTLALGPAVTVGLIVLVLLTAIYAGSPNFRRPATDRLHPRGGDLLHEWVGGWMVRNGEIDRLYDASRFDQLQHDRQLVGFEWDRAAYLPPVYPPYYYWLVSPLSRVPFLVAIWVWAGLMVAALLVGWTLVLRTVSSVDEAGMAADIDSSVGHRAWQLWCWWGIVPVLLLRPVIDSLTSSQKGPLLLLIFAAFLALAQRRKLLSAGLVAGLLVCKPQWLIVMVPWLVWRRDWRTLAGMVLTAVGLIGVAWWLSPRACLQYVDFLAHSASYIQTSGYEQHLPRSACWHGAWSLLWGSGTAAARVLTVVSALTTLAIVAWICRRPAKVGSSALVRQFSLVILATCLVNPHLFAYDLIVLLIPLAYSLRVLTQSPVDRFGRWWPLVGLWVVTGVAPDFARATRLELTTWWMFVWLCWLAFSDRFGSDPFVVDRPGLDVEDSPLPAATDGKKSLPELAISGKTSQ